MKISTRSILAIAVSNLSLGLGLVLSSQDPKSQTQDPAPTAEAIVVLTPSAPHPQARVRVVDLGAGVITFDWLDANGQPVDTGNSQARITVTGDSITEGQKAILAAGITAATANP